jgi:acyl carrier protein
VKNNPAHKKICCEIENVLREKIKFSMELQKEKWNINLSGKLKPRDMLYLFFTLEDMFNIHIPEEDIVEGRFNSINNIAGIIRKQIYLKNREVV